MTGICANWRIRALACLALAVLVLGPGAYGSEERYEYDPAGRLCRILSADGPITQFTYDALGNLLSVRTTRERKPPEILSVTPESVRAGASHRIQVTGRNLAGVSVLTPDALPEVADLITSAEEISFLLPVAEDVLAGTHRFRLRNPDGEAAFGLEVLPPLPSLSVSPLPLALPLDGSLRRFLVRLSRPDRVDRTVGLSSTDTHIAVLETHEVRIPAGATEAQAAIRGIAGGVSRLQMTSEGLEPQVYSVYVTADYGGVNSQFSPPVGLTVGEPQGPALGSQALYAGTLGVAVGPRIDAVTPAAVPVGAEAVALTVHGLGLGRVSGLRVDPPDDISLSDPEPSPDGRAVRALASVSAGAQIGWRRLVATGPDGPYRAAAPGADLVRITPPPPLLESVSPNYGERGNPPRADPDRGA